MRYTLLLSRSVHFFSSVAALNIAQGKPAYKLDSIDYDYLARADLAVDGIVNQYYHQGRSCAHTTSSGNVSWEVDLQGINVIESVKLYNTVDYCRIHKYAVFVNHLHTGTTIDTAGNITTDIMTCSLFNTLNFQIGGGANDVIIVISYYAGAVV